MHPKIFFLVLLPLFLISCNPTQEPASKISSTGQASVDIKPDTATIHFQVLVFHKDAAAATKDLALTSLKLVTYFNEQKIEEKDIEAHEIEKNIIRNTDDRGRPLEIQGYEITRNFNIQLKDLKNFETFMRGLYAMPNVCKLSATFSSQDKVKQEDELLQQACVEARSEAEKMAKGFGVSLGRAYRISKEPVHELSEFLDFPAMSSHSMSLGVDQAYVEIATPIFYPPATIKLTQEISVIYELKD